MHQVLYNLLLLLKYYEDINSINKIIVKKYMQINSGLIWITGFSSAGKTTLARSVVRKLNKLGYPTIYLDGDDLRKILGGHLKYDRKTRIELAKIYFRLCKYLSDQEYHVIISTNSMFKELFDWVNNFIPNSIQIYLDVPENIRKVRDLKTKNLYSQNKLNNEEYDLPVHSNLKIKNYSTITPSIASNQIVNYYLKINKFHP